MPRLIKSEEELRAAFRARRDELNVTHASLEVLIGLPDRYLSKVIAAKPIKGISPQTFRDILDGMALGIVAIVIDEDQAQAAKLEPRWVRRRRMPTTSDTTSPRKRRGEPQRFILMRCVVERGRT